MNNDALVLIIASCRAHEERTTDYTVKNEVLQFDARPNRGDIVIERK